MAKYQPKYFVEGASLKEYCIEKGLSYTSARNIIVRVKRENPSLNDDEIVKLILKSLGKGVTKYFYKGMSLAQYCKINNIDNTCVRKQINKLKLLDQNKDLSAEELIELAIKNVTKEKKEYLVNGKPLVVYCGENNINYGTIIGAINRYKRGNPQTKLDDDSIVSIMINRYLPNNRVYYVENETLTSYCKRENKDISTVKRVLKKLTNYSTNGRKRIDISKEVIELVINNIKNADGALYYYNGITLKKYCIENGISYNCIIYEIIKCKKNGEDYSIEDLINKYLSRKRFEVKLKDKLLLKTKCNDIEFLYTYSQNYNLCYKRILELMSYGYSGYIAANLIDYCSDIVIDNKKSISEEKVESIEQIRNNDNKNLDELLLLQGLGYSGMEFQIIKCVEAMIVIILNHYNLNRHLFVEYKEYLENKILETLENKDFTLKTPQFITYLEKKLNGDLVGQLNQQNKIILESEVQETRLRGKSLQSVEDEYIKKERISIIRKALNELSSEEIAFVKMRYGFNGEMPLTLEEIHEILSFNGSIEELKDFEENILKKLRNNNDLQMVKSL